VGFRATDAVIALYDLTCPVTGGSVRCGDPGVILKQVGSAPATFKVRFTVADPSRATVVLDGVTDRDIARTGAHLGDPHEVDHQHWTADGVRRGSGFDPVR
jgi:hypothetical protein